MKVKYKRVEDTWEFTIFNGETEIKSGWTHIVNLELYSCMTPEEYILQWCL